MLYVRVSFKVYGWQIVTKVDISHLFNQHLGSNAPMCTPVGGVGEESNAR